MKIFILISVLLFSSFIQLACKKDNPVPPREQPQISITSMDVSCSEAWLNLKTVDLSLPTEVEILKDSILTETITMNSADTILYIDSLLPNKTYSFSSIIHSSIQTIKSSVLISTLDTTSHNFTWQTFEFGGQAGGCILNDVAIIDENNIWAVGEIYLLDSLGQPDPLRYNAVHWSGYEWEIKRVPYYYQGQPIYNPIQSVFAFDSTDIWFCGNGVIHWDGTQYTAISLTSIWGPHQMNKIWGTSSNDLYIVGNNGNIAHNQNGHWSRIESGTNLDFLDIYGMNYPKTNEYQILAVCTRNYPLDKGIFSITGDKATQISTIPIQWELDALWFVPNRHYYVIGSGIYEKNSLSDSIWRNGPLDITHYGTGGIMGDNLNNIFVAGAFGEFLHFNGISWKSFINELGSFSGSYGAVAVKNNMVITVGYEGAAAKILLGKRN